MPTIFDADAALAPVVSIAPVAATNLNRGGVTAGASRIRLNTRSARKELERPSSREWQRMAWMYYDAIGEVKFAFNLVASIMSRVRLYPGLVLDRGEIPRPIPDVIESLGQPSQSLQSLDLAATEALDRLDRGMGIAGHLKAFSLNRSVAGEMFFVGINGNYYTVSMDEIIRRGDYYALRPTKESGPGGTGIEIPLPKNSYVSRIWQQHPRWSREPDSTMLGVLDQCEKLLMIDKALRTTVRSSMNAGLLFIPDGVYANTTEDEDDEEDVASVLLEAWTAPISDESVATSVVPQVLQGAVELGEKIKWIQVARSIDQAMVDQSDRALDRVLAGIDIPKDIVNGLSDVKYANAVMIDDNLYRAHIEPGMLMAVDTLTKIYYRPMLRKMGVPESLVERSVLWYDPSGVIAHPDTAAAADKGHEMYTLSDAAWREKHGFSEEDAPDEEEVIRRMAIAAGLTPDVAQAVLNNWAPELFEEITEDSRETTQMPNDVANILDGGQGEETPGQIQPPPSAAETPPAGELPPAPGGPNG